MGVHTTFVRSVDLDEWTQRQIDAMRLGGNANCRTYFRKHGVTDMHGNIEKKYNSKAAKAYRVELSKLVDAQAAQRGEVVEGSAAAEDAGNALQNLNLSEEQEQQLQARQAIAAAKNAIPVQPKAKLASQLPGAGKLATPPNSGNGPKLVLRKLSSGASSASSTGKNLLKKKKPTSSVSKLRVNKLSTGTNDAGFADIGAEPPVVEEEAKSELPPKAPVVAPAPIAPAPPVPTPAPQPPSPASPQKAAATMDESMAKLKAMNNDFFAGM